MAAGRANGDNVYLVADETEAPGHFSVTAIDGQPGHYRISPLNAPNKSIVGWSWETPGVEDVRLWTYDEAGAPNQQWRFHTVGTEADTYTVSLRASEEAGRRLRLAVAGEPPTASANVALRLADDTDVQAFVLRPVDASAPVPVELSEFSAEPAGKDNLVRWTTAAEVDVEAFSLERTADGASGWMAFAELVPRGTAGGGGAYEVLDREPLPETYYRLRTRDRDGSEAVSAVVHVRRSVPRAQSRLLVFPNPAPAGGGFVVEAAGLTNVEVSDVYGRRHGTRAISSSGVEVSGLAAGLYVVSARDAGGAVVTRRVVVQ